MPILVDDRTPPPAALYGDGSDGDVSIVGTVTVAREMFYNSLTVPAGAVVNVAGFRVCVRHKVTNFGTIHCDGGNASGATGGTDAQNIYGSGTHNGGSGGSNGANGLAPSTTVSTGYDAAPVARGGNGGNAGAFIGGASGTVSGSVPTGYRVRGLTAALAAYQRATLFNPGSSGGGGAAAAAGDTGGGGGARGGFLYLFARSIDNFGSIRANGGNGANGTGANAGGGGGGGGGIVFLIAQRVNNFGTIAAAGGSKGLKIGTGIDGVDGNAGAVVQITAV